MEINIFSNKLETRIIKVHSEKITGKIRFALISDLHSSVYGEGQSELIDAVNAHNVDAVLYAGDIFDSRQSDDPAKELLKGLSVYPSIFVTGNHEMKHTDGDRNRAIARNCGVTVLQGDEIKINLHSQEIVFCGVDDAYDSEEEYERQLELIKNRTSDAYRVFLLHNPEKYSVYDKIETDLMVCGHVHGGHWRLPFINRGLVSPKKNLFPKYCSGYYKVRDIDLVVSRGLSKTSTNVPRIFNRPEIIFIDVCPLH